jgi:argininosuccinate synthase
MDPNIVPAPDTRTNIHVKKVVLGFSGGLDTTYCAKYLHEEKGYEVHSIIVNTGGFTKQELSEIEHHAYSLKVKTGINSRERCPNKFGTTYFKKKE